jgi:hypothetical protein
VELLKSNKLRVWILTIFDLAILGATYLFFNWLFGREPTLAEFALATAILALLDAKCIKWR